MTEDEADDIKRYFDVVAERMESKIEVVAEGHGLLAEKIDHLGAKVDKLEEGLARLAAEVAADREQSRREHAETRAQMAADREQSAREHAETRAQMAADREQSRREHAETRAMIKLSFGQLDERLTALERAYAELRARLELIEKAHAS